MSTGNDNNNNNNAQPVVAKKRGRKSKKELELAAQKANALQNITVQIEESPTSKECITSNIDFLNLADENNIIKDANNKNGDLAVYMANPSKTKVLDPKDPYGIGPQTTAPGVQRGDPRNKDGYMFFIISLYYKLPRKGFIAPKF